MASVLFAFAAAFSNALNVVTQHFASTSAPARDKGWRLALYLVRSPLWLFGVLAMVGSFVLQAVALYNGPLSVVQSILVTELVFSLVLGRAWLRRPVSPAAWLSGALTTAGLAVFLTMSEPKGGHPHATPGTWSAALLTFGGATVLCTVLGGGGSPIRRAGLYATGSGIVWALVATFLKSASDLLGSQGVGAVFEQGAIYGVVAAGIIATLLTQAALHYGPLAISQPLMVIVDPLVSILLGVWLFGEHFRGGPVRVLIGAVGFAAMVVGVVFLARTAPSLASEPAPAPPAP